MRAFKLFASLLLLLTVALASQAQDESGFTSTVNWFFSACEDRIVIDFSGTMEAGYDLYFQAFNAYGGLGDAITGLRRVTVDGDYAVSQIIYWLDSQQLALGNPVSVVIRIGSEIDPDSTLFQEPSDDVLKPCEEPGSTLVEGIDLSDLPQLASSAGVFTPDGGLLNPVLEYQPGPVVQIGARPGLELPSGRTADPGLIFATCLDVEGADPGVLYDTDAIRVFWSWYATTAAQVQDHLNTARYSIRLHGQTFPSVQVSEIKQLPGSADWWVFYTVNLGDKWEPNTYEINFSVSWSAAITDGYENFGPGTANDVLASGCQFTINRNPFGVDVMHEQPALPLHTYPWPE